jgi:hypothetical protein
MTFAGAATRFGGRKWILVSEDSPSLAKMPTCAALAFPQIPPKNP